MAIKLLIIFGHNPINIKIISSIDSNDNIIFVSEKQSIFDTLKRVLKRNNDTIMNKLSKLAFFCYYAIFLRNIVYRNVRDIFKKKIMIHPVTVNKLNDDGFRNYVSKLGIDCILLMGTSILDDEWIKLEIPILNIHLGIAPKYRGRFCWFWPVIENDQNNIGVTCHKITNKVDQGEIIIQSYLDKSLIKGCSFVGLFINVLKLSKEVVDELINMDYLPKEIPVDDQPNSIKVYYEPGLGDYYTFLKLLT